MNHRGLCSLLILLALATGCSNRPGPGPLLPDYHYQANPRGTDEARHVLVDRPEKIYDSVSYDLMDPKGVSLIPQEAQVQQSSVTSISPTATEAAQQQMEKTLAMPTTGPAAATSPSTMPAVPQMRVWLEVGGVVVQVNGHAIYAGDVLKPLRPMLAAEARRYDADGYRVIATNRIKDQIKAMIRNELTVAQAEKALDQSERDWGWQMTMVWKQQQVAAAGGSLEQAKARAAAEGNDFDEMLKEKLRENEVRIYYEKKLVPRLQVTAQDMREYYRRHVKDMFSEPEEIQFRLIKIEIKSAGREDAQKKITDLKDRVARGEDFQTLATQFNDDSRLAKTGGLEQPIARGAYVNEKVEKAAWALQPGKVSDIIEAPNAFYLVKLESHKDGHVRPFEDLTVQLQIDQILKKQQFSVLVEREMQKLLDAHPIDPDPPRYELAVEMAMQMYPQWAAK
jgi:parvulin-like peptidyl-prolyl isomerase